LPKAKCNDINVYYEVKGDGFPLVMIQGLSANMDWWDPKLVEAFTKKYKTVFFDNRGAGRSDAPKTEYSIKMFADDTVKLMDNLKIPKAHVVGVSMGGMIAQEIAASYPQKVEKLVLWSTACGASKSVVASPKVLGVLATGSAQTAEQIVRNVIPLIFTEDLVKRDPEFIKRYTSVLVKAPISPDAFGRQVKAIMTWDVYDRLPKFKMPTLIIAGKKDILIPPQNAKIIADRIPASKLVYFDKSAHALFEETDKVISTTLQFLA
jgi:pimeloyl-ACP methyl ester carboxylesterase